MIQMMQSTKLASDAQMAAMQYQSMANSQYIPLNRLNMKPSAKEVENGWDELLVNINANGHLKKGAKYI